MGALGAVAILTAIGWIASSTAGDARLHRLSVESELRGIAHEIAGNFDTKALEAGQAVPLEAPGERLEQLEAIARVEPAELVTPAGTTLENQLSQAAEAIPSVVTVTTPVMDPFGEVVGHLRLVAPGRRPLLSRLGRLALATLLAGALVTVLLRVANAALRAHCEALEALADGRPEEAVGKYSSAEICRLAVALDQLQNGDSGTVHEFGAPVTEAVAPEPQTAPAATPEGAAPVGTRAGAAAETSFEPGELLTDIALDYQMRAKKRNVEISTLVGDRVPDKVTSRPLEIGKAVSALMESALKSTRAGKVLVRVSREPSAALLRFEVRDTGDGMTAKQQDELRRQLQRPEDSAAMGLESGIQRAHILATGLGGELEFDSHPGAGSRVWFTVPYEPEAVLPAPVPEELMRFVS